MTNFALPVPLELKSSQVGSLGVIEFTTLDFVPARIYWLVDVPHGSERGHHAHKTLTQLICMLAGSVEVELFQGTTKTTFHLNQSSPALILKPGLWRVLKNFSQDACVLVLCDQPYDESDYIRNYKEYIEWCAIKND